MKVFKNYLRGNMKQILLFVFTAVFCSHCFRYPSKIVEYQFQRSDIQEEEGEDIKKPVILQTSIHSVSGGDKCADKSENHPCYKQCERMYYWQDLKVKECQRDLSLPQINILEETFDFLWEPDFEKLQSIHPDNFIAYLNISNTALSRIIRKYGSREVEHFMLWIISNEEITKIFDETDTNFNRLADLLYRVAPYTQRNVYEPFIDNLGNEKLMSAVIKSENEIAMELFLDFINHTNKDCKRETVSRNCFNIYCHIGRAIDRHSRRNWRYFDSFSFYLSEIVHYQINSQQGQGRDRNSDGWVYREGNRGAGFSDEEDVRDFVKDLCQGLGED